MKLYHIFYTTEGQEKTREEFATNGYSALNQAKKYFSLFGNGTECDFEIFEV